MNEGTSTGLDPRAAGLLAYAGWWVTGAVFLLIEHEHRDVRFHAAQAVVVFGFFTLLLGLAAVLNAATLVVVPSAFRAVFMAANLVWVASVIVWLILMVRTLRGEVWRVPVAARIADRLARRQAGSGGE